MSETAQPKISKEKILTAILFALVAIIIIVVVNSVVIPKIFKPSSAEVGPQPPAFLNVSLPSIDKIQGALNNSKLEELKFYSLIVGPDEQTGNNPPHPEILEDLAKRVKAGKMGRPNPFVPFDEK